MSNDNYHKIYFFRTLILCLLSATIFYSVYLNKYYDFFELNKFNNIVLRNTLCENNSLMYMNYIEPNHVKKLHDFNMKCLSKISELPIIIKNIKNNITYAGNLDDCFPNINKKLITDEGIKMHCSNYFRFSMVFFIISGTISLFLIIAEFIDRYNIYKNNNKYTYIN